MPFPRVGPAQTRWFHTGFSPGAAQVLQLHAAVHGKDRSRHSCRLLWARAGRPRGSCRSQAPVPDVLNGTQLQEATGAPAWAKEGGLAPLAPLQPLTRWTGQ